MAGKTANECDKWRDAPCSHENTFNPFQYPRRLLIVLAFMDTDSRTRDINNHSSSADPTIIMKITIASPLEKMWKFSDNIMESIIIRTKDLSKYRSVLFFFVFSFFSMIISAIRIFDWILQKIIFANLITTKNMYCKFLKINSTLKFYFIWFMFICINWS